MRIEVACDESGFSGTNLLDPDGEVFTHASVRLSPEAAGRYVAEVRARFPYPPMEFKSKLLLHEKQRPVLEWLLRSIHGDAHVHLTDKTFFVVNRVVDVLLGELSYEAMTSLDGRRRTIALALYRQGPRVFGRGPWRAFLDAFVTLMRLKQQREIDALYLALGELPAVRGSLGEVVESFRESRSRVESVVSTLVDDRRSLPPLEPLIPAMLQTALYWGSGSFVHDEQSALTRHRLARIGELCPGARVRLVDSRSDPRVQVADLLAGAARRIAWMELRGHGDHGLTALLRPYVDPFSIWADARSWSRLTPDMTLRTTVDRGAKS